MSRIAPLEPPYAPDIKEQFDRIMRGDNITKPTVSDLLEKETRRPGTTIAPPPRQEPGLGLGGGPLPAPG